MPTIAFSSGRRLPTQLVLFLTALLIASACATPAPTPSAVTRPAPTTSAGPNASGQPASTDQPAPSPSSASTDWSAIDRPTTPPVASLVPTKGGPAGAALATAFRLTSLDGTPVGDLIPRLSSTPAIALQADTPTQDSVTLRPSAPLAAGTTYRFKLRRDDGTTAAAWAVVAAKPLHLVGSLPGDETADVPTNTGIEMTFDQTGVTAAGLADAWSIEPKTAGRFEVHGRVIAFVPTKSLKAGTLYTVTVRRGLPLPGTGQSLGKDATFRFETADKGSSSSTLHLVRVNVDAGTRERAAIGVWFEKTEDGVVRPPATVKLGVHRLAGIDAAMSAYRILANVPDWARTGGAPIDTRSLPEILRATVPVHPNAGRVDTNWLELPTSLPAGWYVTTITHADQSRQVLVQVTNLAAYAQLTTTRSVVWVNDIVTGKPVPGATIRLAGRALGRTDAQGLRIATTPSDAASWTDASPHLFVITDAAGRTMFTPVADVGGCAACDTVYNEDPSDGAWWHVFELDRSVYRTNDQVNAWGMLRDRQTGARPDRLEVRLQANDYGDDTGIAPITTIRTTVNAAGVFLASVPLRELPPGDYRLYLVADGKAVDSAYFRVGTIRKPAYALTVTTDRHATIVGTPVVATTDAAFFDGTPVAGVDLKSGFDLGESGGIAGRTDATGRSSVSVSPTIDDEYDQWQWRAVGTRPTLPEEAQIPSRNAMVAVFKSSALLDATGSLVGTRLTVSGTVRDVDFAKFETIAFDWDVDPHGKARPGATVQVTVTELIPVRTRIGTAYDFITKTTHPLYQYDYRRVALGTKTATTGANGMFTLMETVTGGTHGYDIVAAYRDEAGRRISTSTEAFSGAHDLESVGQASLSLTRPTSGEDETFSIGERVSVRVRDVERPTAGDRYLYVVASNGLRSAVIRSSRTYAPAFRASWVPNAEINAVRFTGSGFEPISATVYAGLKLADRGIRVDVRADATRYAPGGHATITVRTRRADGTAIPASVVVRVIDEKLYASDQAASVDTLQALYAPVQSGVIGIAWSHRTPVPRGETGGGDTTGGGGDGDGREDFRDIVAFREVTTDASGRGTLSFDLPDDLTSWRLSASAIDTAFRAGDGTLSLPVGLPFFAEPTIAPAYLAADRPILRLRGYGSGLHAGDAVTFIVSAPSLGMGPTTVTAAAFTAAEVALPALSVGEHAIRISASTGSGAGRLEDTLTRTIQVVTTRATQGRSSSSALTAGYAPPTGVSGLATVVLSDAGRGRVIPGLMSAAGIGSNRADSALAASLARRLLRDEFGVTDRELAAIELSAFQSPDGGIALLPYASSDLELSALAAMSGDPGLDLVRLDTYLIQFPEDQELTRERSIVALAGRAALGDPVLDQLRDAASAPDLSPTEQAWLAAGAAMAGDDVTARALVDALLSRDGQRLGPWVRLQTGDPEGDAVLTALAEIAAAGLGDPIAADLDAYLDANPPKDTLLDLQRTIAARSWAEHVAGAPASVTVTVDGATRTVTVTPDQPLQLTLTPTQLASLRLAPVTGKLLVSTRWDGALEAASFQAPTGVTFQRTVTPAGPVAADATVIVTLDVGLTHESVSGCWSVTDLVPSGLAPIAAGPDWYDESEGDGVDTIGPWRVDGQRVDFCVQYDPKRKTQHLRYAARVVTPGAYRWESAVIQSSIARDQGMVLAAFDVTIRGTS